MTVSSAKQNVIKDRARRLYVSADDYPDEQYEELLESAVDDHIVALAAELGLAESTVERIWQEVDPS